MKPAGMAVAASDDIIISAFGSCKPLGPAQ